LYTLLMCSVFVGVAANIVLSPDSPDSLFMLVLCAVFIITSGLHGELKLLICGIIYLFFLPTMYLILIMYAMGNIHDQSWGTRDDIKDSGQNEADKFFSWKMFVNKLKMARHTVREAWVNEKEESKDAEEGLVAKPIVEEKISPEEIERLARERQVKVEEVKKKKEEKETMEKIEEKLKRERRKHIHHRYKEQLWTLSLRLKKKVEKELKVDEKESAEEKLERIRQLASLTKMTSFLLFLVTVIWLIMVLTVGLHQELTFLKSNSVGLLFLISFGIILVFQFLAAIIHRLETFFNAIANIPMTFSCGFVEEGGRYAKVEQREERGPETTAEKLTRRLLFVDKRTATRANLFMNSTNY